MYNGGLWVIRANTIQSFHSIVRYLLDDLLFIARNSICTIYILWITHFCGQIQQQYDELSTTTTSYFPTHEMNSFRVNRGYIFLWTNFFHSNISFLHRKIQFESTPTKLPLVNTNFHSFSLQRSILSYWTKVSVH